MDVKIKRLLKDLFETDDDLRALAAMTIMKLDFPEKPVRMEVLAALMKATSDNNIAVRFFVRKAIDKIKRAEKLMENNQLPSELPVEELLNSTDYEERLKGVTEVSKQNDPAYKERLVKMLEIEEHSFVKATLISCLKHILDANQASVLGRFISDPDRRVRSNTIEALEFLKAEESIPTLFPCLNDKDNRIRAAAAKALGSFGEEKVFRELKKMLDSGEEWMRASAIYALSHIHAKEAIDLLIEAANKSMKEENATKAIIALANYHDLSAYSYLMNLTKHSNEHVREAANYAIKLAKEKFGQSPPTDTISKIGKSQDEDQTENLEEIKAQEAEQKNLSTTVKQFFRAGVDKTVSISEKTAIKYAATGIKKEIEETCKEAGQIMFEIYQSGGVDLPDILTMGHEILRMNYFLQKARQEKEKAEKNKPTGFFEQLKGLFVKSDEIKQKELNTERFAKKKDELLIKLGKLSFKKFETEELQPTVVEPFYLTWKKLNKKLADQSKD